MTRPSALIAASNPFSTRFVKPGAIPFIFPAGQCIETLVTRLAAQNWYGQIIGPHGTGKSTLIAELLPVLQAAGLVPQHYRLHNGKNTLPRLRLLRSGLHSKSILVIDGYEQLAFWLRWRLRRMCRRAGCGLLVTAHRPIGLPDLHQTHVSNELAEEVFLRLSRDAICHVTVEDLSERLRIRCGNLRDALFDLYDLHERRRERESAGTMPTRRPLPSRTTLEPSESRSALSMLSQTSLSFASISRI